MKYVAFAIAATLAVSGAQAVTVNNGSFETPDYPTNSGTYVYNPAGADWTFAGGGAGITAVPSAWNFTTPPDGDQVAFLQNVASISQLISGLTAGDTYALNFSLSNRPGYGTIPVTVAFGGNTLATITPVTSWTAYSYLFTASGTSGLLSFSTNTTGGDNDAGLDAVSIAAVPEAATWAMMVIGFGATGAAMRGSRKRTAVRFA